MLDFKRLPTFFFCFFLSIPASALQAVGKVPSSDSISNDAEMKQMVARVISDPTQDLADDLECTAVDKDLPQAQVRLE